MRSSYKWTDSINQSWDALTRSLLVWNGMGTLNWIHQLNYWWLIAAIGLSWLFFVGQTPWLVYNMSPASWGQPCNASCCSRSCHPWGSNSHSTPWKLKLFANFKLFENWNCLKKRKKSWFFFFFQLLIYSFGSIVRSCWVASTLSYFFFEVYSETFPSLVAVAAFCQSWGWQYATPEGKMERPNGCGLLIYPGLGWQYCHLQPDVDKPQDMLGPQWKIRKRIWHIWITWPLNFDFKVVLENWLLVHDYEKPVNIHWTTGPRIEPWQNNSY